ncbi:MAG: hypothetical protein IJN42_00900 [Clostridia bacterium]|nr:hypothetical protein [Clostridia bacterium]
MSPIRKQYFWRLGIRIAVLILCAVLCFVAPQWFSVMDGMNFFKQFSPFHLLWAVWVIDMIQQIIPLKNRLPLGSQKLWAGRFKPIREKINLKKLREYIAATTAAAYRVMVLWCLLIAAIGVLYYQGVINVMGLFMISVLFYVCDLICVLIWCPFRLMMKTRCCTTCRIFNWDHLMMFSPLIFAGGFYAWSLVALAILAWVIWEGCVFLYPERFWEMSNSALKCSECTDKLCTQYCQKLRNKQEENEK